MLRYEIFDSDCGLLHKGLVNLRLRELRKKNSYFSFKYSRVEASKGMPLLSLDATTAATPLPAADVIAGILSFLCLSFCVLWSSDAFWIDPNFSACTGGNN